MSVFILLKKKKKKRKCWGLFLVVMFKGDKMNFFSIYNSSIVTDTLQVSSFVSRAALTHICQENLWCNDTLIHFITGNIGHWNIHADSLWNSYSLLLILLQLKEFRRNFSGISKIIAIQKKSKSELRPHCATYNLRYPTGSLTINEIMAY